MTDIWTKQKRSEVMSLIRAKGNQATELAAISIFRKYHISGWRRNQKLIGKPDFTFKQERVVVFIDGCFWHGCPQHIKFPKSNRAYWKQKLAGNMRRDKIVSKELRQQGWHVIRIWEHELKNQARVARKIQKVLEQRFLRAGSKE